MNNIYIIGRPLDLYRTQTFVKAVMDSYKEWNLSISYFTFTRLNRGTYFIRFFKLFIYGLELLYALFQICRADYIYTPPMIIAANRFFKIEFIFARFLKKKIICEFYISTYDTMVLDRKKVSINSSIANRLLKWDRKLQTCYRTIFLNKTEAGRYSSIVGYKLSELNYVIIPLSIRERSKSLLPYYTKNANTFNIVWWGSYIPLHGLPKIISAVKELINEGHNIHLFIMGNSKEKAKEYVEMVREYKHVGDYITISNDYTFLNGRLEPFIVEKCDLAMGAFGDSEKAKNVILNKCIEAVSMKIPVLTQNSAAFQEFFPETNTSIFYSDNSVYAMKKMILNIMNLSNSDIQYHI
ncbi:MAG: glycosyltransferase, partial [Bacteroides sp.]|nr:glycosyltransferase [Bacteroides sp.]